MKKLMIAAATVCAAAFSQGATFDWASSAKVYLVDAATVVDNGSYSASGSAATKSKATLTYVLTILDATTGDAVGTANGNVAFSATGNKFKVSGIEIAGAVDGTKYNYTLDITGTEAAILALGQKEVSGTTYDYTASTISTTLSGEITTAGMGNTDLDAGVPASWTVAGITKTEPTPEPTSAMLMFLGMAGLALRRRRA